MQLITPDECKPVLGNPDVAIVDVRESGEFLASAIPGAIHMPLSTIDSQGVDALDASTVVVYCLSGMRAAQAAQAIQASTKSVYVLSGGIRAWQAQGGAVHTRRVIRFTIMQQVQIIAGGCVLAGVILSKVHHPYWVYVSGFMGTGLLFAGLSGWCGMAKVLVKLPWNRSR
ncbi:MAG: rhodanese-like domain-containing protein [bacterium]|nr:rhodanese-like domain-containing protein [bacterium]